MAGEGQRLKGSRALSRNQPSQDPVSLPIINLRFCLRNPPKKSETSFVIQSHIFLRGLVSVNENYKLTQGPNVS